jgi:hypothetical protein
MDENVLQREGEGIWLAHLGVHILDNNSSTRHYLHDLLKADLHIAGLCARMHSNNTTWGGASNLCLQRQPV